MKLISATNLVFARADKSAITCTATFEVQPETPAQDAIPTRAAKPAELDEEGNIIVEAVKGDPGRPAIPFRPATILGPIPFTAAADDPADHGVVVFNELKKRSDIGPYVAPVVVEPVPFSISDRQCFQQLAIDGLITQADALAAVKTGSMPPKVTTFLTSLPASDRFTAEMLLSGATTFERAHPLAPLLAAIFAKDTAWLDDFFRRAAKL